MVYCIVIDKDNIYKQDLYINQIEKLIVYENGISIKHTPTWIPQSCPKNKLNLCLKSFGIDCKISKCNMSIHKSKINIIDKYYKYREYNFPEYIQINYLENKGITTIW